MNTYEVFLKKAGRDEFRHAGSLDAPDPEMALMYASETHARRGEGAEMWLVDRRHVLVGDEVTLAVNTDKPHRHNDGALVAARRKERRADETDTADTGKTKTETTS
jgi:ring-1,2-phenylacetyl-CoA epoxidase subunit PaaB